MSTPVDQTTLIRALNQFSSWELSETLTREELERLLAEKLNDWIRSDFAALLQFLYRIDVNESKLRVLLKEKADEDAGLIIARLVVERQLQKIQSRQSFRSDAAGSEACDEERW